MEIKEISNLFDVDFGNVDENKGGDWEIFVFKRIFRVGIEIKLGECNLCDDLDS